MYPISELGIDPEQEAKRIDRLISDTLSTRDASGVVLGLSGGLDSSVVAALSVRALDGDRVRALIMPERDSSADSAEDARLHAEQLGIDYEIENLTEALGAIRCYEGSASELVRLRKGIRIAINLLPGAGRKGFLTNLDGAGGRQFQQFLAFHRMKHRLRMIVLHREAEKGNLLVMSCANRTEFETGFFVRYGDDSGDIAPIKHLYKTQVFQLGRHLGLPEKILGKQPSPDLFAGMKDEEILGMRYSELDSILWCLDSALSDNEIMDKTGSDRKTIDYVKEIKHRSRWFREPPSTLAE
jgi:NAD+ synthase